MSKKSKSIDMKSAKLVTLVTAERAVAGAERAVAGENLASGSIKVRVIQAHLETIEMPAQAAPEASPRRDGSGYVRRRVGDEIEIDVADFCENVHEKILGKPANGQI